MLLDLTEHIPTDFAPESRVWIYQASRPFLLSEALELEPILENFVAHWKSHGAPVKGLANLFYGRFIVLMADETRIPVGGCSTDSSVHLIKSIEKQFHIDLLDRQSLAFWIKDKIEAIPLAQFSYAIERGFIKEDSLYFDNTVSNKQELLNRWPVPVKESWLKRFLVPQT